MVREILDNSSAPAIPAALQLTGPAIICYLNEALAFLSLSLFLFVFALGCSRSRLLGGQNPGHIARGSRRRLEGLFRRRGFSLLI